MREIKLRWFDKVAKECGEEAMIYSDNLPDEYIVLYEKNGPKLITEGFDCDVTGIRYEDVECEAMQFTGLSDKNGTPIYQGDIVRWTNLKHYWEAVIEPCEYHPEGQLYAIETVNNLSFDYDLDVYTYKETDSRKGTRNEIAFLNKDIEVIGNIYETIKEGKE